MAPRKCVYIVRGRPCGRPGAGNPPLCERHAPADDDAEENVIELDPNEPVDRIVGVLLQQPGVQRIFDRLGGFLDGLGAKLGGPAGPRPAQRPAPRPPSGPSFDPRAVLGFKPDEPLTAKMVKDRRRALATKFHSDHQGSDGIMALINQAADALLAELPAR